MTATSNLPVVNERRDGDANATMHACTSACRTEWNPCRSCSSGAKRYTGGSCSYHPVVPMAAAWRTPSAVERDLATVAGLGLCRVRARSRPAAGSAHARGRLVSRRGPVRLRCSSSGARGVVYSCRVSCGRESTGGTMDTARHGYWYWFVRSLAPRAVASSCLHAPAPAGLPPCRHQARRFCGHRSRPRRDRAGLGLWRSRRRRSVESRVPTRRPGRTAAGKQVPGPGAGPRPS
jgi:hypothetical protein